MNQYLWAALTAAVIGVLLLAFDDNLGVLFLIIAMPLALTGWFAV